MKKLVDGFTFYEMASVFVLSWLDWAGLLKTRRNRRRYQNWFRQAALAYSSPMEEVCALFFYWEGWRNGRLSR